MHSINSNIIAAEIEGKIEVLKKQSENLLHQCEDDLSLLLESAKININDEISANPTCITIKQDGSEYIWGTLGNFSAVIGKAKSRKSFLVTIAIAAAIKKSLFNYIDVSFLPGKDKVLFFDTEQSKYHVHRVLKRICILAETALPETLNSYGLRKFTPEQRLKMIEYAIYNTEDVGLVVIDGLRDLVTSINDEEQATIITSKLLKWTEERNIHIIIVLHQNKGDNNARGHVGSEIINKAETVISVTKDFENKDISIVQPEYCRDREFEPFAFHIDEHGMPFIDSGRILNNPEKRKAFTHLDIPKETHHKVLTEVFALNPAQKYGQLCSQLKIYFENHGIPLGRNKIIDFITFYQNEKMIITEGKPKSTIYKLGGGLVV